MSEISWFQCYSWFPLSGNLFSHSSLCVYCTNTWTRVQLHAADRLNNTLNLLSKFNMHVTYQFEMENLVVSASNGRCNLSIQLHKWCAKTLKRQLTK